MPFHRVRVGEPGVDPVTVGDGPLVLIGGPCVIEGESLALRTAERLKRETAAHGIGFIYKSSYAKENRGTETNFRGPGADEGLEILAKVRRETGVPVLSDVHAESEIPAAAEVLDVLQIPAYLCQQTGLVLAAAATGRTVNVKKGQFLAPEQMGNVVEKLREAGAKDVLLTERGVSFGYGALIVDFRSLPIMRAFGHPVVFDGTHSVQRPGGLGNRTGGDRREVPALLRAAAAVGVDGFFMEVHENPDKALSDGPNSIALETLEPILRSLIAIRQAVGRGGA